MTGSAMSGEDARERILRTASALFYRDGTRAVGVDLVVAQAGVAKTTLYRHFPTKDDLIEAFLRREDASFWQQWDVVAAAHSDAPDAELEAQLRWIGERIARPGYRGCPQINIAAEYADDSHAARRVAASHKAELRHRLTRLAHRMQLADPERFALRMAVAIDGALASGQALLHEGPAQFLIALAQALRTPA